MGKTLRICNTPWCAATARLEIDAKVLVNYRDFHLTTQAADWRMSVEPVDHGLRITPSRAPTPFYLKSVGASVQPRHEWYRDYLLASRKRARPR